VPDFRPVCAWQQLERFIGLYLPAGPADPSWIL
jgi:hypothetical protein